MANGSNVDRGGLRARAAIPFWLCAGVALAYANSLTGPFLFDDIWTIRDQMFIRSPESLPDLFRLYPMRFLTFASMAVNWWIHGADTRGYHLVNITLHAINGMLVYRLFTQWMPQPPRAGRRGAVGAMLAALCFALTPMNSQAVSYISARSLLFATGFLLLSLLTYGRARSTDNPLRSWLWFALSILWFSLGLFSKEVVAVVPALIVVWEFWCRPAETPGRPFRQLWRVVPYALAFVAIFYMRHRIMGSASVPFAPRSVWINLLSQSYITWAYAAMQFVPIGLTLDHALYEATGVADPRVWVGLGLWACAAMIAIRSRHAYPWITVGLAWWLIGLSPDSSVVAMEDIMVDHRAYLPSIGLWFIVGRALAVWWGRIADAHAAVWTKRAAISAIVLCVGLLSTGTVVRNVVWSDPSLVWEEAVRQSPGHARPLANLAAHRLDQKNYPTVIALVERANAVNPGVAAAYMSRGLAYLEMGEYEKAQSDFSSFIALYSYRPEVWQNHRAKLAAGHFNLGLTFQRRRRYTEAEASYQRALTLNPISGQAMLNLATVLEAQGKFEQAVLWYGRAGNAEGTDLRVWDQITRATRRAQTEQMLQNAAKAAAVDDLVPWLQLGSFYDRIGLHAKAETAYEHAQRIDGTEPLTHVLRGNLARRTGDRLAAVGFYRQALAFQPDNAEAHWWLGQMLVAGGVPANAQPHLQRARELDSEAGFGGWRPPRLVRDGRSVEVALQ